MDHHSPHDESSITCLGKYQYSIRLSEGFRAGNAATLGFDIAGISGPDTNVNIECNVKDCVHRVTRILVSDLEWLTATTILLWSGRKGKSSTRRREPGGPQVSLLGSIVFIRYRYLRMQTGVSSRSSDPIASVAAGATCTLSINPPACPRVNCRSQRFSENT
ncbi:hypothetical protein BU24DRAFT_133782 [Aaosphaeria arxii CBS 175.79]|uniref:Uncharacterized protein n=1 Tax=Aaosphaeria arxii CBS 175.79 TaxID=1450172 RepID=A0A6A5Y5T3_9PLEO|nr:uncharacterized protein BU24DRAFT_133782 [Aaosphaeria arxii CBS 175.79]KAF2020130.1 hypothetical protein BU24DRAFT_133782 [Aaosphaeria arxii CBS 175.79]